MAPQTRTAPIAFADVVIGESLAFDSTKTGRVTSVGPKRITVERTDTDGLGRRAYLTASTWDARAVQVVYTPRPEIPLGISHTHKIYNHAPAARAAQQYIRLADGLLDSDDPAKISRAHEAVRAAVLLVASTYRSHEIRPVLDGAIHWVNRRLTNALRGLEDMRPLLERVGKLTDAVRGMVPHSEASDMWLVMDGREQRIITLLEAPTREELMHLVETTVPGAVRFGYSHRRLMADEIALYR